jgi:mono/diheme cytochrome c family protein
MKVLVAVALTIVACGAAGLGYVYSGAFDAAADTPHGALLGWIAQAARERSVAVRARDIEVPNLDDPERIAKGADEYAQMCAGCHLAPGVADNAFRKGLNPPAPELAIRAPARSADGRIAAEQFWIIKHGIKMSAMPAWGASHDDRTLWSIVAFLQKLPSLSAEQYAQLTANSAAEHDATGDEHHRGDGENDD